MTERPIDGAMPRDDRRAYRRFLAETYRKGRSTVPCRDTIPSVIRAKTRHEDWHSRRPRGFAVTLKGHYRKAHGTGRLTNGVQRRAKRVRCNDGLARPVPAAAGASVASTKRRFPRLRSPHGRPLLGVRPVTAECGGAARRGCPDVYGAPLGAGGDRDCRLTLSLRNVKERETHRVQGL